MQFLPQTHLQVHSCYHRVMKPKTVDEYLNSSSAEKQLHIIGLVDEVASKLDIPVSLRGGWAVDFLLGRITRLHDDVDLNAWTEDGDRLQEALLQKGFVLEGTPPEPRTLRNFLKDGVSVQVAFVERLDALTIYPADYPEYPLSIGLMEGPIIELGGVKSRTATAHALLDAKNKKLFWDEGEQYREKDIVDMKLLQDYIQRQQPL